MLLLARRLRLGTMAAVQRHPMPQLEAAEVPVQGCRRLRLPVLHVMLLLPCCPLPTHLPVQRLKRLMLRLRLRS